MCEGESHPFLFYCGCELSLYWSVCPIVVDGGQQILLKCSGSVPFTGDSILIMLLFGIFMTQDWCIWNDP